MQPINFQTDPSRYRHWRVEIDGEVASLIMDVDQAGSLFDGVELKLNSYDLGVDIELADAVQSLEGVELLEVLVYLDSLRFGMAESGQLLQGVVRGADEVRE